MPWFSFHGGHSGTYCRHARGTLPAVVERAYQAGFTTFGLSEHAPRCRKVDLFPDEADLEPADLAATFARYLDEAAALRTAWAERLEILVGLETEVVPPDTWLADMTALRADPRVDYIVGSVHTVGDVCIDLSAEKTHALAGEMGGPEALQRAYLTSLIDMIERLRPEVVGHLDVIRKFDDAAPTLAPSVAKLVDRVLEATRAVGAALDVNASPARRGTGPVYPAPDILVRARALDVAVTLGDDSHGPDDVGVGLDACVRAIAAAGYREVSYLTRSSGAVAWHRAALAEVVPARTLEQATGAGR